MSVIQRLQVLAAQQPHDLLYEWFDRTSDGDISVKHSFSYSQAYNRVSALACHLVHKENLLPGDRVLLCYPPCLEFLFAFLGCILANVIPVPAYPPNPQALKATIPIFSKIKNLVSARIVLTNKRYYRWTALNLFVSWPAGLKWVATDAIITPRTASPSEHWQNGKTTDTAFLQFTSGTTGDPKAVIISHRALWESFRGMTACEGARIVLSHRESPECQATMDQHSRETRFSVMSWLPLYHDLGLVFAALLPIFRAGSASLCSPLDFIAQPLTWLIAMSKTKATVSCAPNFAFDLVVKRWQSTPPQQRPLLDLSCVRFIPVGGEAVRAKSLLKFAETFGPHGFNKEAFCPSYGGAECTVAACAEYSSELIVSKRNPDLVSCGSNFERSGMLVTVLKRTQLLEHHSSSDFSNLEVAEEAEVGEIMVTGNALSSGYWTGNTPPEQIPRNFVPRDVLPSAVREISDAHPGIDSSLWFATGDLGLLEAGRLFVTGRINEAIVVRGRSHVASDIEHTVMTSTPEIRPGCIAAVAVTNPNSANEEAIILCETRDLLANPKAQDVMGSIRRCVGEVYGIKSSVALLKKASLPKTTSGKLQRTRAAGMWETGFLRPIAIRTVSEQTIGNSPPHSGPSGSRTSRLLQLPGPEGTGILNGPEALAWEVNAPYAVRCSALHAQIDRIVKSLLPPIESSSEALLCEGVYPLNTEWTNIALDSQSAALIMQALQEEANKALEHRSTPVALSASLLSEYRTVKTFIEHLVSLHDTNPIEELRLTPGSLKAEIKPVFGDKKDGSEHKSQSSRSVSVVGYLAFVTTWPVLTFAILIAVVYIAIPAFSHQESLVLETFNIPLVPIVSLLTLVIATVLFTTLILGIH